MLHPAPDHPASHAHTPGAVHSPFTQVLQTATRNQKIEDLAEVSQTGVAECPRVPSVTCACSRQGASSMHAASAADRYMAKT
jgi:hypothetical protein